MILPKGDREIESIRSDIENARFALASIEDAPAAVALPARSRELVAMLCLELTRAEELLRELALALGVQVGGIEEQPNDPLGLGNAPLRNSRWFESALDDRAAGYFRRAKLERAEWLSRPINDEDSACRAKEV